MGKQQRLNIQTEKSGKKPSLRLLIIVTAVGLSALATLIMLFLSSWVAVKNQKAYAFESQFLRHNAYHAHVAERVRRIKGYRKRIWAPASPLMASREFGMNRVPVPGEVFFGVEDHTKQTAKDEKNPVSSNQESSVGKVYALVSGEKGELYRFDLVEAFPHCRFGSLCYIATGFGKLVQSSDPSRVHAQNFMDRPLVQRFLESGMASDLIPDFDPVNLSFRMLSYSTIPKTNLIVFMEVDAAVLSESFLRTWIWVIIVLVAIFAIQASTMYLMLRRFLNVFPKLAAVFQRYSNDQFRPEVIETVFAEADMLTQAAEQLGYGLKSKSAQLAILEERLTRFLDYQVSLTNINNQFDLGARAVQFFMQQIGVDSIWKARIGIQESGGLPDLELRQTQGGSLLFSCKAVEANARGVLTWFEFAERQSFFVGDIGKLPNEGLTQMFFSPDCKSVRFILSDRGAVEAVVEIEAQVPLPDDRFSTFFARILFGMLQRAMGAAQVQGLRDAQRRMDVELLAAGAIQQQLELQDISVPGYRIDVAFRFASRLSGDWFQMYHSENLGILVAGIADVTGHGIVPSQLSVASIGVFQGWAQSLETDARRERSLEGDTPQDVEARTAHLLAALERVARIMNTVTNSVSDRMIQTAFFLVIDLRNHNYLALNLGHTFPMGMNRGSLTGSRNPPLGALGPGPLSIEEGTIEEGTGIFLFTDGLTENFTTDRRERGRRAKEIHHLLQTGENHGCPGANHVLDVIASQWPSGELQDDVSVLSIFREPRSQSENLKKLSA